MFAEITSNILTAQERYSSSLGYVLFSGIMPWGYLKRNYLSQKMESRSLG